MLLYFNIDLDLALVLLDILLRPDPLVALLSLLHPSITAQHSEQVQAVHCLKRDDGERLLTRSASATNRVRCSADMDTFKKCGDWIVNSVDTM
ncbi:uncharacterized protein V6R79_023707 [Siganus canaliculatus]